MSNYLIIGGTGAIGAEVARRLLAQGAYVHVTGRTKERVDVMTNEIGCEGSELEASDFAAVTNLMERLQKAEGPITGVVNCAGSILLKPAHLTTQKDLEETLMANLHTAFATVHGAGKVMSTKGGSVVLLSSAVALEGIANHEAIAAAKAGVIGLMQAAAATYADCNLRFNAVAPGLTDTPLSAKITGSEKALKISREMHPLHRIGTPSDIASAIVFMLDPSNSWITGQVLAVDGGLSRVKGTAKVD